jgi:tetratricopeptide (TPR) repeat protein
MIIKKGEQSMRFRQYRYKIILLFVIFTLCGCAKSELRVANFIRPPSKVVRFRDIQTILVQEPDLQFSGRLTTDLKQLYQHIIQENIAKTFGHMPWYQIHLICPNAQCESIPNQIEQNGYEWKNSVRTEKESLKQHQLFINGIIDQSIKNQSEINISATLSIVLLDPEGNEVYVRLLDNLKAKDIFKSKQSHWDKICMHRRLAQQLFQLAIVQLKDDIYPKKIKRLISINNDADIRGRYLLEANAFPEALAHIEASIKKKERAYIEQKNKILEKYQKLEKQALEKYSPDDDFREKRIEMAKEKEAEIDKARKCLSGDYKNYGTALEALGFIDEASTYYEKAIHANPMNYLAKLAFHRLVYFRKTSNKELELSREITEKSLRSYNAR